MLVASTRTRAGDQQLTVRLDPPELGHVSVAISQPRGGGTSVTLTVERPDTLLMVLRDAPALHRALDRAGIASDGRTVTFELAPHHDAAAPVPVPQAHGAGTQQGGTGVDLAARDNGQRHAPRQPAPHPESNLASRDDPRENHAAPAPIWRRDGIDITA